MFVPKIPLPHGQATRVLGVFAHPDDETLFAGATFASYAEAGCQVRLITLTAGEGAELEADRAEPTALDGAGRRRLSKYAAACAALGVEAWEVAEPGRWRDLGRLGAEGSLAAADPAFVVDAVGKLLTAHVPHVLITVDADGVTGHPDHIRAHDAVVAAVDGLTEDPPLLLGACVRRNDVREASARLQTLAPGKRIGAGGIQGVESDTELVELRLSSTAVEAKQRALAAYFPRLASEPLEELLRQRSQVGDVGDDVLLFAISEIAGADRELFRIIGSRKF